MKVRSILIRTADCAPWGDSLAMEQAAIKTVEGFRDWMFQQTQHTGLDGRRYGGWFDYEHITIKSHEGRWFQTLHNDAGETTLEQAFGPLCNDEGLWESQVWNVVKTLGLPWNEAKPELGWEVGPRVFRHLVTYVGVRSDGTGGGGGWAGGRSHYTPDGENYGQCIYGDWDWRWIVNKDNSPCGLPGGYGYGRIPAVAALGMSASYGHEMTHAFEIDSHNPVIFLLDPLTEAQKQQYLTKNMGFVYMKEAPVPVPVPSPTPTPVPVPVKPPRKKKWWQRW